MEVYLFQIEMQDISPEMIAMIPEQRARINKLQNEGKILSYSIAASRKFIWIVVAAKDEQEAMETIAHLPMYPFYADIMHHHLMVYDTQPIMLPDISLN
jgi:hypothetical protein